MPSREEHWQDASATQIQKTPLRGFARAAAPWAKPKLKSFVRLAPFLGAVAFLVTNKKVPRRLTARWRTGDSPPFDTAVIVPGCKSPNTRLPAKVGLNGETNAHIDASLLHA